MLLELLPDESAPLLSLRNKFYLNIVIAGPLLQPLSASQAAGYLTNAGIINQKVEWFLFTSRQTNPLKFCRLAIGTPFAADIDLCHFVTVVRKTIRYCPRD